jgi:hypothetical protein
MQYLRSFERSSLPLWMTMLVPVGIATLDCPGSVYYAIPGTLPASSLRLHALSRPLRLQSLHLGNIMPHTMRRVCALDSASSLILMTVLIAHKCVPKALPPLIWLAQSVNHHLGQLSQVSIVHVSTSVVVDAIAAGGTSLAL